MNPILAGVALAVIAGAIVVVSVRDARVVVLGLAVVLVLSAVLADPLAAPAGLAARFVAAILAAYLLWIAARDRTDDGLPSAPTEGSRIGWPAEVLARRGRSGRRLRRGRASGHRRSGRRWRVPPGSRSRRSPSLRS